MVVMVYVFVVLISSRVIVMMISVLCLGWGCVVVFWLFVILVVGI